MAVIACPAVPPDLLESEFFGHAKGAFTGSVKDYAGRVALCAGGTLFLDEIGDLAPSVQAKLLRLIQDKEYERLGEATTRRADVRIIVATNADLEKRVAEGRFREDLFYRLNVISLLVPPLRERPEDILPLAEDFLSFFCRVNHKTRQGFTPEAAEALQRYSWPGNVRELRNSIERAVILGSGETIDRRDLPETIVPTPRTPGLGDRGAPVHDRRAAHPESPGRSRIAPGSRGHPGHRPGHLCGAGERPTVSNYPRHSRTLLFARLAQPSPFKFQAPTFELNP